MDSDQVCMKNPFNARKPPKINVTNNKPRKGSTPRLNTFNTFYNNNKISRLLQKCLGKYPTQTGTCRYLQMVLFYELVHQPL